MEIGGTLNVLWEKHREELRLKAKEYRDKKKKQTI